VNFIEDNKLKPIAQICTHTHIDHILGLAFVHQKYGLKPQMHRDAVPFLQNAKQQGIMYGLEMDENVEPGELLEEGGKIKLGNTHLDVLHTPGHVDGHLTFVSKTQKFAIVGDVLFKDSIGRTDLPSGDFDTLAHSIRSKIYTLGDDFTIYPGHGPETTVKYELINNPFVSGR
jgi:glyoxylase-like metal-dependent hydrolase (beta-lactamase superfamily II)